MPGAILIDHPDDPRVADYIRLTDGLWRTRVEAKHGFFVAESSFVIEQVLRYGLRIRSLLLSRTRAVTWPLAVDAPVYIASQPVIDAIAGFHAHRGALAAVERPAPRSVDNVVGSGGHMLVVEDVSDHENLGALFRNAAAFGLGGVLLSPRCCDPLYRRAVRVSMGHVLSIPWAFATEWPLAPLAGVTTVALTPDPSGVALDDARLDRFERVALMVGAEGPGLTNDALGTADLRVRIPMAGGVDSLNVATSAAVAMFELTRRRS